jgi:YfiH family protein
MPGPARVRFTSRTDGDLAVGLGSDELASRRQRIVDRPWFWLRQVHGDRVVVVDDRAAVEPGIEADAVVTTSRQWALAVHTADCAPLVLTSDGVVGAVHAGWRGLEAGVIGATVEALRGLGAGSIEARLGPCIHAECYEFGTGDLARLARTLGPDVVGETSEGRPALDVPAAVRSSLTRAGVDDVDVDPTCTACSLDHFSHRARGDTGRQAAVVWLDSRG